jgi:D-alanine-D-alanine ligase
VTRIRVGVLFGGRSDEHEVSVSSARALIEAVDQEKFEIVPIGITKQGAWLLGANPALLPDSQVAPETPDTTELVADVTRRGLVPVRRASLDSHQSAVDVVFPLLHGPYGEDGTVQGLLELAGIPYIGAGVLASAVGMDKAVMKALFQHAGLEGPRYEVFSAREWERDSPAIVARIESNLGLPVFVKPCRMGSSVGISKAKSTDEVWASIAEALAHDTKVIVEEMITGREIECGLLGHDEPAVSVFGEVVSTHEFYDYESKYTEGLADLIIPVRLSAGQAQGLTEIARRAFNAIDAEGMARVDFFIEAGTERLVLNEINTMPGFAPTSMFPKLWEASGLSYAALFDRLVELALERHGAPRADASSEFRVQREGPV